MATISVPMTHDRVPYVGQPLGLMDRDRIPATSEGAPAPISGDASMIVRVQFDLDSGSLKYQNKQPVHIAHDSEWSCLLLDPPPDIEKHADFGDGRQIGNCTLRIDDIDDAIRSTTEEWTGKPVTIYIMEEVDADGYGTWALIERERWIGAVDRRDSPELYVIQVQCTENQGLMGEAIPAGTITSALYPTAPDSSLGKPIPLRAGTFSRTYGAVEALAIDTPVGDAAGKKRKYLLNGIATASVEAIFVPGSSSSSDYVAPPAGSWAMYLGSDGMTYIHYTPPTGSSTVPDEAPDAIRVNMTEGHTEPTECLKAVLDGNFGPDVFFAGANGLNSEYLLRGYVGQINIDEKTEVKSLVSDFCLNFDCFAQIGDDGKLLLGLVNPASVATFGTSHVLAGTNEDETPDDIANYVTMRWGYDWCKSEFAAGDLYNHASSVATIGRYDQEWEYSMIDDRATAIDVTRRRVRQVRSTPRSLAMEVMFEDQTGVSVGDVITVNDTHLIRTGDWLYKVKGKRFHPAGDSVYLLCQSYSDEVDHVVEITRNMEGAEINPFGIAVVADGDDLTIIVTPDAYHSVDFYWIDRITQTGSGNSHTLSAVTADHTVEVVLLTDYWPIMSSDDAHSTISPKGTTYVEDGKSQSYTAAFDPGYEFSKWIVDGSDSTVYPYVFSSVAAEHTIQCVSDAVVTGYVTVTVTIHTGSASPLPFPVGSTLTNKGVGRNEIFGATATQVKLNGVDRTAGNTKGIYLNNLTDMNLELWF